MVEVLRERACQRHHLHHLLLCLHVLLHASRIGITPHFPSPFQITDPSRTTILHKHLPVVHQTMALNHSHPPVNLNQLFHLQPCSLLSPMFPVLITLQPPRPRVVAALPKVIFRIVMQLSGLRVSRVV
jgi:hypothetical protein